MGEKLDFLSTSFSKERGKRIQTIEPDGNVFQKEKLKVNKLHLN